MGVVGTVVVEADALVWNSDCRVAPARTLVLFPPSRFFRLRRCGTLLRGSTFPGNRLWAHVCSESCAHLPASTTLLVSARAKGLDLVGLNEPEDEILEK